MAYIGTQPKDVRSFGKAKFDYTSTQGQTAFTGADDDNKTLGFTDGQIEVFVNGILMDESDFTTSNGNTVTLASAANLNDVISIVAMQTDIPNSDYVPISGGTFTSGVTVQGTVAATAYTGDGSSLTGTGSQSIVDNGNATAITIDASENVLVNAADTDPQNLTASSNSGVAMRSDGRLHAGAWQDRAAAFGRGGTDGEIVVFRKDAANIASIGNSGSAGYLVLNEHNTSGVGLYGSTNNGGTLLPADGNGSAVDGTKDLGRSDVRWRDLYLSGGAYIGGTGNANKLDDYEEGSFTPVLSWATPSNGSVSYIARTGTYIRVGRAVTIHLEMRLNVVSQNSASLPLLVSGFPFNFHNTGGYGGSLMQVSLQGFTFTASHIPYGWGLYNSDQMYLFTMSSNAGNTNLATPPNYKTINVSGTYITPG